MTAPPIVIDARAGIPPAPKGAMRVNSSGRLFWSNSERLQVWRDLLQLRIATYVPARGYYFPPGTAVDVVIDFYLLRPKSHTRKQRANIAHTQYPDLDKLIRAVLDELTGTIIRDDREVVSILAGKQWTADARKEGAFITVTASPERSER